MDKNTPEKICVIGTGYVGLTLGLTLCDVGFKVTAIDKNEVVVRSLLAGKSHIYEKGIDVLLRKYIKTSFFVEKDILDKNHDIYIICVGTPVAENKTPNLSYVQTAAEEVGAHLKKGDLVILRSTVPVGTTREVVIPILESKSKMKAGSDFQVVFAPERTIEGKALAELRELPQIIGGVSEESVVRASNLFSRTTHTIIHVSSVEGAEMIKIMDNTFRDISFAISNEFALISEVLGLDIVELIKAARMGYNRTNLFVPSPGVGGACLSKDPYILNHVSAKKGYESALIKEGRRINEYMPLHVVKKVKDFLSQHKKTAPVKIFIMGFAFKGHPVTADTRFSPTLDLLKELKKSSYELYGYDEAVSQEEIKEMGVKACSVAEGFQSADAIIVMLNNHSYGDLDIAQLLSTSKKPVMLYDGWQIFKREETRRVPQATHIGVGYV